MAPWTDGFSSPPLSGLWHRNRPEPCRPSGRAASSCTTRIPARASTGRTATSTDRSRRRWRISSHLLRDHHSGERITIDVGVIDFLAAVMDGVGAGRATVLSAYRTVATNRMLAKTTFGVADNSQHIYGRALDIRFDFAARGRDAAGARRCSAAGSAGIRARASSISIPGRCGTGRSTAAASTVCCRGWKQLLAKSGLPKHIVAGRAHHPLSIDERLSLQRVIAKAEFLARRR